MRIYKEGMSGADNLNTQAELEAINRFAKTELTGTICILFSAAQ